MQTSCSHSTYKVQPAHASLFPLLKMESFFVAYNMHSSRCLHQIWYAQAIYASGATSAALLLHERSWHFTCNVTITHVIRKISRLFCACLIVRMSRCVGGAFRCSVVGCAASDPGFFLRCLGLLLHNLVIEDVAIFNRSRYQEMLLACKSIAMSSSVNYEHVWCKR